MKISVIIPTYKPQDYLWQCLKSLYQQTFSKADYEVILVLNGCHEPWFSNIREFISCHMQGTNVNFIHTGEPGVSNARNLALDCAKGEYVTFIDDDDYISPLYLEELYAKAAPDTIALCYPYAFNDRFPKEQLAYSMSFLYEKLRSSEKTHFTRARKFFSGPCMKLIPTHCISDRRLDVRFSNGEDSLFMFLISDKFHYVATAPKTATYYRRYRENSAVTRHRSRIAIIRNSFRLISCYTKIYLSNPNRYNLSFYLTRIIGSIRQMWI